MNNYTCDICGNFDARTNEEGLVLCKECSEEQESTEAWDDITWEELEGYVI